MFVSQSHNYAYVVKDALSSRGLRHLLGMACEGMHSEGTDRCPGRIRKNVATDISREQFKNLIKNK